MAYPSERVEVVRVASWAQYRWLRHGFSTRYGGVSSVYGGSSLNLGWTKEDDPASVRENRRRFAGAVIGENHSDSSFELAGLRQTHSADIREVSQSDLALRGKLRTEEGKPVLEGDGLMTGLAGVLLAVGTADCVPVLVADTRKRVVAAFHAGWRGTVARIVETGVVRLQQSYGSRAEDLVGAIGPSIGPCCYAVGDELYVEFGSRFGYADQLFRKAASPEPWRMGVPFTRRSRQSSTRLNLWEANRLQLRDAGLRESQITVVGACTACSRDSQGRLRYFSHRGEDGVTGRMLSAIGIAEE